MKEMAQNHEMSFDELMFFEGWPQLLPIYSAFKECLQERYADLRIKPSRAQISFYNERMFAMVSLPQRRKKEWPKECLMLSFGLDQELVHERIVMAVEAYPKRWTHHVLIQTEAELDEELLAWMEAAYRFSSEKR